MENLEFLYSLMSPYLFQEAKNNIKHLEYYFSTNPDTSGSPLVHELIEAIKVYDYQAVGDPLFKSILSKTGKSRKEAQTILEELKKWQTYPENLIQPSRKLLADTVAKVEIDQILYRFKDSPSDAYKAIKNSNVNTGIDSGFCITKFEDLNMPKLLADNDLGSIKTCYGWLNDVFQPHNGIERGQIGIICAPPGVGKSLFAMNLALYFAINKVRTLYVTLGDLSERDWVVRLGTIYTGCTFAEAYRNFEAVGNGIKKLVSGYLDISVNPSGKITAQEIVDACLNSDYEAIFVDYDANHKGASDGTEDSGSSMYSSLGAIYSEYTRLSLSGRLVFMCSQPKISAWHGLIGLTDIGESKRKQETADFIVTISDTAQDCPNHLYTAYIPKARRGRVGTKKYLIRIEGRFIEIPKGVYDQLSQEKEEINYTQQEIERIISEYRKLQNGVTQKQNTLQSGSGPVSLGPGFGNGNNPYMMTP